MNNSNLIYTTSKILVYENDEIIGTGTSFFAKSKDQIYLITCNHVIRESDEVKILLLSSDFNHVEKNTMKLETSQFSYLESDDIAWINITKPLKSLLRSDLKLLIKTFDLNIAQKYLNNDIDILESVYFIGYPSGIIDNYNLTPLVRKSNFSTVFKMNFNNKNQFLIDGAVFPGSSGSPVFINYPEGKILIGVVQGTYISGINKDLFLHLGIISKLSGFMTKIKH